MAGSKIMKCELASKDSNPVNNKELTIHNIKPGFLVSSKVSRLLENGIELSFLGGFTGTVFVDHLDRLDPSKYKIGEKLNARLVSADTQTQSFSLSLLPHLLSL
jgi:ribosomal protein S1